MQGSEVVNPYLQHELRDDPVEGRALEVQRLAFLAHPLLACTEPSREPPKAVFLLRIEQSARRPLTRIRVHSRSAVCWLAEGVQRRSAPVQSARKFSTVLGACLPYSPSTTRPASSTAVPGVVLRACTTLTATYLCMQEGKRVIWPLRSPPADFPPIEMSKNTCRNSQRLRSLPSTR